MLTLFLLNLNASDMDGLFGRVPQTVVDDEDNNIRLWHQKIDIVSNFIDFDKMILCI